MISEIFQQYKYIEDMIVLNKKIMSTMMGSMDENIVRLRISCKRKIDFLELELQHTRYDGMIARIEYDQTGLKRYLTDNEKTKISSYLAIQDSIKRRMLENLQKT